MKTKRCCTCKIRKQLKYFSKNKKNKDGHAYDCKKCHSSYKKIKYWEEKKSIDYSRICPECNIDFKARRSDQEYCCTKCYNDCYFRINKEKLKNKAKIYNKNNKEKLKESGKRYRINNAEKLKVRRSKYYQENKVLFIKKSKLYYKNNKGKIEIQKKNMHSKIKNG